MAKLRKEDEVLRDIIKQRIINLRTNQEELKINVAKKIDMDRQNLQPWEDLTSNRGISIYSINRVCKAFNISLKEFFDDEIFKNL